MRVGTPSPALEYAARIGPLYRPAGAGPRRHGRPAAATVLPAAVGSTSGGSGGTPADVQALQSFMAVTAPHQQGPSIAQAQFHEVHSAVMPPLPAPLGEQWPRARMRRHLRRRRIEVEVPAEPAEPLQASQQQGEQQGEQAALQQQQHAEEPVVEEAAQQAAAHAVETAEQTTAAEPAVQQLAAPVAAAEPAEQQPGVVAQAQTAAEPQQQAAVAAQQQHGALQLALPQLSVHQARAAAAGVAQRAAQAAQRAQVAACHVASGASVLGQQQLVSLQQLSAWQLGNLQQAAGYAQQQLATAASRRQQAAAAAQAQQAAAAAKAQQQRQAAQWAASRQVRRVAAAAPPPAPPPLVSAGAATRCHPGQVAGAMAAAAVLAIAALRGARAWRRRTRSPQDEIREAEQRARAAKLYDRQRQRFHRALLAAEDLEGADSSVFTAVSRKGQIFGPGTLGSAPGRLSGAGGPVGGRAGSGDGSSGTAGVDSHAGAGGGAEGDVATLAAAGPLATADAQDGSYDLEESAHAFDPASWDEDTRKQWDAFVASSKVNKGTLWDSSQVDEGLPEVWVDLNK